MESDNCIFHLTDEEKQNIVNAKFRFLLESNPRLMRPESRRRVEKAFYFAQYAHQGQIRKTGLRLPFIIHPIEVAIIVSREMGFSSVTVAAALLHDVVEDTEYTKEDIEREFGTDVAIIVSGLTKITNVFNTDRSEQVETFRHLIMDISHDRRIAYIKIADRLNNLRTLDGIQEYSQMVKTAESLEVYAPLAYQLGLFNIRNEIENLSFRYRYPVEYSIIKQKVDATADLRNDVFEIMAKPIREILDKHHYQYKIIPMTKSLYRTWEKLKENKLEYKGLENFQSVRVVFTPVDDYSEKAQAYIFYSLLTDMFHVNNLTDCITTPRANGFEALITNIMINGQWFELQILTERMDSIAQRGYAKDHENLNTRNFEKWVRSLGTTLQSGEITSEEIMELIQPDSGQIQVFTDKGDIISIKKGATVLDFAYQIHSEIGSHFKMAIVNGEEKNFTYVLEKADQITIVTEDNVIPRGIWRKHVVTTTAIQAIRRFFSEKEKKQIDAGRKTFMKITSNFQLTDNLIHKLCNYFKCRDKNELYRRITLRDICEDEILKNLPTKVNIEEDIINTFDDNSIENKFGLTEPSEIKENISFNPKIPFIINNPDIFKPSNCCNVLPGDQAMVYKKNDSTFIVHRTNCKKAIGLNATHAKKTAVVEWNINSRYSFPSVIEFKGEDRPGLLLEMIGVISKGMHLNMTSLRLRTKNEIFTGLISFLVSNKGSLEEVIDKISKIDGIQRIYRV